MGIGLYRYCIHLHCLSLYMFNCNLLWNISFYISRRMAFYPFSFSIRSVGVCDMLCAVCCVYTCVIFVFGVSCVAKQLFFLLPNLNCASTVEQLRSKRRWRWKRRIDDTIMIFWSHGDMISESSMGTWASNKKLWKVRIGMISCLEIQVSSLNEMWTTTPHKKCIRTTKAIN